MQDGGRASESDVDVGKHLPLAATLGETLDLLVEEIRQKTPFERAVVAAGFQGRLVGAGLGIDDDVVDAFVDSLRASDPPPLFDGLHSRHQRPDLSVLPRDSWLSPYLVRLAAPSNDFVGAAVVDAEADHPALDAVGEAVRLATPFIVRHAELDALRASVRELEAREARSRLALDTLPSPVLVTDEDNRILLANRRAAELLLAGPDQSAGLRHAVETNNLFFSAFRARTLLEKDSTSAPRELLMVDPVDGSDLLFEVFHLPFRAPSYGPASLIYVLRDITDLKHAALELEQQFTRSVTAEHEARRESERLNVIIENAGVPILVTDRQTKVVLMNREAERLFESTPALPRSSPKATNIGANDAKLAGLINDFLLQSRIRREAQLALVDPDEAREFPALAVSTKILNQRAEPTAVVTVLHDLTKEVENRHLALELRRFNAELEQRIAGATSELAQRNELLETQRAELERASRMKSEFLATMSHELRTPINAVLGYLSLLRHGIFGNLSDKQDDALHRTRVAAEHLLSLINDILDLSTVEAGKVQLRSSEIDLATFIEGLSETVSPMAAAKSLVYRVDVDPGLPKPQADATRLRQIVLNLLSNAVKFTDSGAVTVRARSGPGNGTVCIDVADTGIGIDGEDLEAIFEEFRQVDQSVTRQHGGTGLGLAISRKLIALMGGTLDVESRPGEGSTFTVELPLRPLA